MYSVFDKYGPKVHPDYDMTELKKKMKEKEGDGKMCALRKSTG